MYSTGKSCSQKYPAKPTANATEGLLKEIISEEEFLKLVNNQAVNVLRIGSLLAEPNPRILNKKLFYIISSSARDLEDFLDGHGAKNNRTWYYFRELIATARGFGFVNFLVEHIESSHIGHEEEPVIADYIERTQPVKEYLREVIVYTFSVLREESERLHLSLPPVGLSEKYYYDIPYDRILPQNLDEGEAKNEREHLIKIASTYMRVIEKFEDFHCDRMYPPEDVRSILPSVITEEKIRKFELSMHNLESVYDTYVKDSVIEAEDRRLIRLRTQIYIALHLLEIARALTHFCERHDHINQRLEQAIKSNTVPGCTINWALFSVNQFMQSSRDIVNDLLADYTATDSVELPVPVDLGFHLRPSTLVAKVVNHYGSDVVMKVGSDTFDAKSVLNITWAGGKIAREKIKSVTFVGDKRTLRDLEILASVNYGEDRMGKDQPLPKELSYLR